MNLEDKELIEQIRNHFNISPTTDIYEEYPIRIIEILQYTKNMTKYLEGVIGQKNR